MPMLLRYHALYQRFQFGARIFQCFNIDVLALIYKLLPDHEGHGQIYRVNGHQPASALIEYHKRFIRGITANHPLIVVLR